MRITAAFVLACSLACAKGAQSPLAAELVYTALDASLPRLYVVGEAAGASSLALSPAGQRAAFVGALGTTAKDATPPATRSLQVVYGLVADDASLLSLRKVNADGAADVLLATLPAGVWTSPSGAWQTADGTILVQLSRQDGSGPALLAIRDNTAKVLAAGRFVALAGNRLAYLANSTSGVADVGDLRSVAADGSANLALGGGDADDEFHGVAEGKLLFTAHHSGSAPELRIAGVDGVNALSRPGSKGLLLSGSTVVAARSGAFEKVGLDLHVAKVSLLSGAQVLALLGDGRVAAFVKGAGVMADGQVLDSWSADSVAGAHLFGDRLVYTMNSAAGSYLRSAKLDGSGATGLSEGHGQQLLFEAELPGSRVLFYRTKATEPGGWLSTVAVAGGAESLVGDDYTGTRRAADQDFGGLTRAGRLVFEAELHEGSGPSLFVVEPGGGVRALTPAGTRATLAAVLE